MKTFSAYEDYASTGPDTLNGRYLRQFWFPVFRSDMLAAGSAKPIRILSEEFTLYRGENGVAHVVAKRCPHRGTQLSVGLVEDDCVRCLYHGWKFRGDGQCVEMPAEAAEFAPKVRIRALPAREHLGLIFAYFGDGEPPAFPPIPAFEGDGLIENTENLMPCNFFQGWENDWDEYHATFTHRTGGVHIPPELGVETFDETDFGVVRHGAKADGSSRVAVFLFPTTIRLTVPSPSWLRYRNAGPALREVYIIHTPVDDTNQIMFQAQHVRVPEADRPAYLEHYAEFRRLLEERPAREIAAEILNGRRTIAEVQATGEFPFMAWIEDQCAQPGQGAIVDRSAERLGRSDKGIIALRKIWSRELRSLAETGRSRSWAPLTEMPEPALRH
jgi:5,5'-dehydrodivanillate O-demethylase